MIKLNKLPKPDVLLKNAEEWTTTITNKIKNQEKPTNTEKTKYRHPEIKRTLLTETNGKCAYCESKVQHIHHGDVEHIFPKSLDPEKTFEWENLTIACEICNQNKSNKDPLVQHIIDPYNVDPALHLTFQGSLIFSLGSNQGHNTKTLLDLNRSELCERRKDKLEKVMMIFETILKEDLPLIVRKTIYDNLLLNEGDSSHEYSAMNMSIIEAMNNKLPKWSSD